MATQIIDFEDYAGNKFAQEIIDELKDFIDKHSDVEEYYKAVLQADTVKDRGFMAAMLIFFVKESARADTIKEYQEYAEQLKKNKTE